MARAVKSVKLNFGTINHAEFGTVCKDLTSDIRLLRCKPAVEIEAGKGPALDSAYLDELHIKMLAKYHECWPNELDEDISIKVQDCVDEAVNIFCPGLDPLSILELLTVSCIVNLASHDNAAGTIVPEPGDDDSDDDDDEEEEVQMVVYALANKFLTVLREVLTGDSNLDEFLASLPNIHSSDVSMETMITTLVTELVVRPEWAEKTVAQRRTVMQEYLANAQATYLTHYDYLHHNRFTADTYHSFFAQDNGGAILNLELRALFAEVELSADVLQDVMFHRLRAQFGTCSLLLTAFVNLAADFLDDFVMQNSLLINFHHVVKRCAGEGASADATRQELSAMLNSWLDKLRGALADLQVLIDVLPTVYPKDVGLPKFLQLLVTGWNGQLQFYAKKQKRNS